MLLHLHRQHLNNLMCTKTQKQVRQRQLENGSTVIVLMTIDSTQCTYKQCP